MTTTVTVKTHAWPVAVETQSYHNYSDDLRAGYGNSNATEFVPADSERRFTVTNTTSVTVRELPESATGLNYPEPVPGPCAASNSIRGTMGERASAGCDYEVQPGDSPDKAVMNANPFTRAQALEAALRSQQHPTTVGEVVESAKKFEAYIAG